MNKDGSWHLIYSSKSKNERTGDFAENTEKTTFGSLDLFADGRKAGKPDALGGERVPSMFVPLPANKAEIKAGWESSENEATQTGYHVTTSPADANGQWVLASSDKGIFHDIYLIDVGKDGLF